jgi:hypothetical protein
MKDLTQLDGYRQRTPRILASYGSYGDEGNGVFDLPCPASGRTLLCVASNGDGWDHVSVSISNRCPNWAEMEHVKRAFFADDETAMQLHVPPADHVNHHPFCLHLWRPNDGREIPRPPAIFVG